MRLLTLAAAAFLLAFAPESRADAQQQTPTAFGWVVGDVAVCSADGDELPQADVRVLAQPTGLAGTARGAASNRDGEFIIGPLEPGWYDVTASSDRGGATRYNVPVTSGVGLDIGTLLLGTGPFGCGGSAPGPV